jgi:RNA polymerase sigma-70 factor, ECF subfamily
MDGSTGPVVAAAVAAARPDARSGDDLWDAYSRIAERLRRTAYRVLRDGHAAEDVVHDAILAAHRNLHLLRDRGNLDPWLVRIARNTAVNHARRRSRCRPDARLGGGGDEEGGPGDAGLAARLESPEPSAEAVTSLREELDAVPASWREAFRARVERGLPFDRIAAEQGVSVACVKTRVSRVRSRLQQSLRE